MREDTLRGVCQQALPMHAALPSPAATNRSSAFLCVLCLIRSLQLFCGEADEESSVIGGPTLLKFVSTFKEVRGAVLLPSSHPALCTEPPLRAPLPRARPSLRLPHLSLSPRATALPLPLPLPPWCAVRCMHAAGLLPGPAAHPNGGRAERAPQPRLCPPHRRRQGKQAPAGQAQRRLRCCAAQAPGAQVRREGGGAVGPGSRGAQRL